jgi:hypothetical protein
MACANNLDPPIIHKLRLRVPRQQRYRCQGQQTIQHGKILHNIPEKLVLFRYLAVALKRKRMGGTEERQHKHDHIPRPTVPFAVPVPAAAL